MKFQIGPVAQLVRASPCHGEGRRFESDLGRFGFGILAQLGEHLPYKQRVTGSSPVSPIIHFRIKIKSLMSCWCGGIGRRKGLKIPRWQHRAGSSPATSIMKKSIFSINE